ncbi:MAG: CorA family divalent cation transporter [Patescibacteria group bacterium]
MIFRHEYRGGVWVDLEKPTPAEIRTVSLEFALSERFERELLSPTPTPLVTGTEQEALLVLHFPTQGSEEGETKSQEIDFVVGKDFILTVRYEIIAPLHHLKKLLEAQQLIEGKTQITTDVLLEILFAHLYTSMRDHINHIADHLTHVEKDMFDGHERATVRSISNISRSFLHLEAALASQEESMAHFFDTLIQRGLFGRTFVSRSERIMGERAHIARIVKTHRATTTELRETNIALVETRQNEIMRTLTIVNIIFLPLGLISWVFAMRAEGMPIIDSPHAFWIILAGMLCVAVTMIVFFIRKKWIF